MDLALALSLGILDLAALANFYGRGHGKALTRVWKCKTREAGSRTRAPLTRLKSRRLPKGVRGSRYVSTMFSG